ncbi:MAG: zinc-binding dehydrogenase [Dehalococcoidia bacterium]|jgi:NADPH:quinone reductase|nr:zinc-binding dehydrogenase [Dehalococcoidia bacterium]
MRAIVVDPDAKRVVTLGEVPEPEVMDGQVLVEVRHIALNYGDLNGAKNRPAGFVPGWDASGVVARAAASGDGPAAGTRVVTTMGSQGGWAERRAVDVSELAVVPDEIDLAEAATLPVAGVTALRALRRSSALMGRRVLVTGASGGVGRFGVQLAALGGAHVIASVGSTARGEGLRELGAAEVVIGLEGVTTPIDVMLDNVGGSQLVAAWGLLGEGGVVQCIGTTSQEPASFTSLVGMRRRIEAFTKGPDSGEDLEYLLKLMQRGKLRVDVGWRGSWSRIEEAADALFGRQVAGKAVLDID